jgi:hypothetical protein
MGSHQCTIRLPWEKTRIVSGDGVESGTAIDKPVYWKSKRIIYFRHPALLNQQMDPRVDFR